MTEVRESTVGHTTRDGVASIMLDRPAASNALNGLTKTELLEDLSAVATDSAVRAVLITAAGRNSCVGQDLAEHVEALRADPSQAMDTVREHYNLIMRAVAALDVPVVAGINGACVGAGLHRAGGAPAWRDARSARRRRDVPDQADQGPNRRAGGRRRRRTGCDRQVRGKGEKADRQPTEGVNPDRAARPTHPLISQR